MKQSVNGIIQYIREDSLGKNELNGIINQPLSSDMSISLRVNF